MTGAAPGNRPGTRQRLRSWSRPEIGVRQVAYAAGIALIGYGTIGLLRAADTAPLGWAVWFAGGVLVHDLLVAPGVLGVALLLTRLAPPWRAALQAVLVVGGSVSAVALPLVLGYGRRPGNGSVLPLDYTENLLTVLGVVAVAGLCAGAAAVFVRKPSGGHPDDRAGR